MSAALQMPAVMWEQAAAAPPAQLKSVRASHDDADEDREWLPPISLAFYRRHTESMLRRYLYASMQVGRAPSVLADPVARGWVSSRPVKCFEDAVIFCLDVERCLAKLNPLDRKMLTRIVIQEYTQVEAAPLLGMSPRSVSTKYPLALDRLTELMLAARLLVLPN